MTKRFKLAALAGAVSIAMVTSGSAMAFEFKYDGWSVANGIIDESSGTSICNTANYTCSVVASGQGFKQINVTEDTADALSSGVSYIMTIVTDQSATGASADLAFSDVSFVKMKLTLGGSSGNGVTGFGFQ